MQNYSQLLQAIFSRLFILSLFTSSLLFADTGGITCEPVNGFTSVFSEKAFLTDSRRACFKTVDDNRTFFSLSSASSVFYFLSIVFSYAGKSGGDSTVFPARPGDVGSHKNQWLEELPSQASVLKTLLKNSLIPDDSFSGEANDRKRDKLEGELELAIANWQKLVKRPSYPAAVVSVSDAAMRVVITRSDGLRNTSLDSLYEKLINIQTQSYLALLDTEALEDIAGIVTAGLVAAGSSGDEDDNNNDNTHYSFDAGPEPLILVYDDKEYPEQNSAEGLIRKNQRNKRWLLKILRKKMQQAIARGHGDLARILDNRVMLITADLERLNDLSTSSTGITGNDRGSPGILSFLKASLADYDRELQQRDDDALIQALSQHPVSTDYQGIFIVSSELTSGEARLYAWWQDTATGFVYRELIKRLEQQLQSETDDISESTEKIGALVGGLRALVHRFREMSPANSSYDGRQVPNQNESHGQPNKTVASDKSSGSSTTASGAACQDNKKNNGEKGDEEEGEGEDPPNKHEHSYSKTVYCPLCKGPCNEVKPEAVTLVSGGRHSTAAKENEKLPFKPGATAEGLENAARYGNTQAVEYFLSRGVHPNDSPKALECAALNGHTEIVKALLGKGAKLSESPFAMVNAISNRHINIFYALLDTEANPDNLSYELRFAAAHEHLDIVNVLLDRGVKPCEWLRPLEWAALNRHLYIVNALLDRGARPSDSPKSLEWAASNGHLNIVNALLDKGAKPSDSPEALEWAASDGNIYIVNTLLAYGVQPSQLQKALDRAVSKGHNEVVNNLLANGAQPSLSSEMHELAISRGHTKTVEIVEAAKNHALMPGQAKSLCLQARNAIRTLLINNPANADQSLKKVIYSLPLPTHMKNYLFEPL
ncbi:ankyrin repeat domain-containing protein [Endozoicomonas euniceicola]|uniref:Ankyrin repeat domain-containing protein n=1 Tax=Endozoicomonas euniceicola TaxID=1234143 RepID=A0ABY6GYP8_9GAMM|nr:ankyrin repeat domain-containing protein [Endozoicomonas euniceicola]UYM17916.1 ankyrin repeat domain-containing protein [Endozoicomonas euniceicola]